MKGRLRHSFEFFLVAFVLIAALFFLSFTRDYQMRLATIALLTLFYVVVGILHHYEEKNLHIKQILEHFAIGAIIFVVLAALFR
ncbi:MAG TPA: hypothetical protein VLE47_03135 [Candidatus Saccharimonadales bacterium]|nr:hypothetical protein [Candidatus Saccharimonadales bacterium]